MESAETTTTTRPTPEESAKTTLLSSRPRRMHRSTTIDDTDFPRKDSFCGGKWYPKSIQQLRQEPPTMPLTLQHSKFEPPHESTQAAPRPDLLPRIDDTGNQEHRYRTNIGVTSDH
eukprot:TRINITY_DN9047_c0_g1_i1.p1 TRINITY_DN9047_c0_g1~~TRINITY_DN9047_c0_g1_i1.p1  ORF type:complete len:116 (-),score=3.59 TRINITY_DN9047_c0_g1_i1:233-580(-)